MADVKHEGVDDLWVSTPDPPSYVAEQQFMSNLLRSTARSKIWKDANIFSHWRVRKPSEESKCISVIFWGEFFAAGPEIKNLNFDSLLAHAIGFYHDMGKNNMYEMVSPQSQAREEQANVAYPPLFIHGGCYTMTFERLMNSGYCNHSLFPFMNWLDKLTASDLARVTAFVGLSLMRLVKQSPESLELYLIMKMNSDLQSVVLKNQGAIPLCPPPTPAFLKGMISVVQSSASASNSAFCNALICLKELQSVPSVQAFLLSACMENLAGAGLDLIIQIQEIRRIYNIPVKRVLQLVGAENASLERIKLWYDYYDSSANNQLAPWCRSVDQNYLKEFDVEHNLLVVTRLISIRVPYGTMTDATISNPWEMKIFQTVSGDFKQGVSDSMECIRKVLNNTSLGQSLESQISSLVEEGVLREIEEV